MGFTIFTPVMMRLEPTIFATGVMAHTWAVGMPTLSISFVSAAPQRVLVPQVEVRIPPETPAAFNSAAISLPIRREFSTVVATPVVA